MCLSTPGRITGLDQTTGQLARADVLGAERTINVGLLADESLAVGDWVIVHLGFAIEVIDADEAAAVQRGLELVDRMDPGAGQ